MSTPLQQRAIKQLMDATNVPKNVSLDLLRYTNFNVEEAIEILFEENGGRYTNTAQIQEKRQKTRNALSKLFDKYKDPHEKDKIGIDGTIQLIEDLKLDMEDEAVLAICMELKAPTQGEFNREGFISGWQRLAVTNSNEMITKTKELKQKMKTNDDYFTTVYRNTFVFNLGEGGQRMLPADTAVPLWQLLLTTRYDQLDKWIEFISSEYTNKVISKDTWNMIWDFARYHKTDPKLENYDEEASWPTVIDEYVDWLKPQL